MSLIKANAHQVGDYTLTNDAGKFIINQGTPDTVLNPVGVFGLNGLEYGSTTVESSLDALFGSAGSSFVGYKHTGTGTVARTVQSKLLESVSIADYGASPTASATQNTTAILAALADSDSVMVPNDTFVCDPFSVPSNKTLFGASRHGSILTTTSTGLLTVSNAENVVIDSLTLITTGIGYGITVFVRNSSTQIRINNCNIISSMSPFMFGDANDATAPTFVWFTNNYTYTQSRNGGIRARTGLDGSGSGLWFVNNRILISNNTTIGTNNYEDVGIETWVASTTIESNVISANYLLGGYSGITFGVGAYGIARNNRISGFSAGIEIGNTGLGAQIIDGNIIRNCKEGIKVATNGYEESVTITNNQIIFDSLNRNDYTYGIYVECQAATISNNLIYYKNGELTYTDGLSRKATGIYGRYTNNEQMVVLGNVLKNLVIGVNISQSSKSNQIIGNTFYNVFKPIEDTEGAPANYFCNNNVKEFGYCQIGRYGYFSNNDFSRSADYPNGGGASISTSPFVQTLNTVTNSIIVNNNNRFTNVASSAFAANGSYYAQVSNYDRPKVEIINGVYQVSNYSDPSAAIAILATCGLDKAGKTILEWTTNRIYVVNAAGQVQTSLPAVPATGTWSVGDIVKNSAPAVGQPKGWVCVTAPATFVSEGNL